MPLSLRSIANMTLLVSHGFVATTNDPSLPNPSLPLPALPAPDGEPCDACGGYVDDIIVRHEGQFCVSCHDDQFWTCPGCQDEYDVNDQESDDDGHCEACHNEIYFTCESCSDEFTRRAGRHSEGVYTSDSGDDYCQNCYYESFFHCESCNCECNQDDYAEDGMCQSCYVESCPGGIRPYSTDALNHLRFLAPSKECMGIELEIECGGRTGRERAAAGVIESLGDDYIILKEDSSLDSGFEIVTAPASLAQHTDRWVEFLDQNPARTLGIKSFDTTTCGMHVHVSRDGLSGLTIGKVLVFMHNPANTRHLEQLAGRSLNQGYGKVNANRKITDKGNYDRYEAVNLQPSRTIEFRLFRGTLSTNGFMKNLEFVHAIIAYCRQSGINQNRWNQFAQWVGRTPKVYPHLANWMRDRDDLPKVKARPTPLVMVEPIQ